MQQHERKTLNVRNPLKPVPERLPCKLTRDERYTKIERRLALERTYDELTGQMDEVKAQAKLKISDLKEHQHAVSEEMRTLREQVVSGEEVRLVDCYLLEDLAEGALYTYRLDTGEVVSRKDMEPAELARLRSQLPLEEPVQKTVDIPADVLRVKRFDSDPVAPTSWMDEEPDDDAAELDEDPGERTAPADYDEDGNIIVADVADAPPAEDDAPPPVRRKRRSKADAADREEAAHVSAAQAH